jgi:putative PIN family toxin of toxin-antitoxin system
VRIVIDTNIFISSLWKGSSRKILDLAQLGKVKLVLSNEIVNEFIKVMDYPEIKEKIIIKNLDLGRTVEQIIRFSEIVEPKRKVKLVKNDPEDNKFLECAIEGRVDYIISKDQDLLILKSVESIPIITPEEFLKKL